ncbi:YceI family protein [Membranihabitans maritimus]|uniref:YceI family protein n=1 Tax=Membranihabitans maritimus TaxID=2904244 RepID=UPI001F1C7E69|nr:YceI family protein [Membranihabitans maritimus]
MTETQKKTTWTIDPSHSEIAFKARHLMITNVKGSFSEYSGSVESSGTNFENAEVSFSMAPSSINTGDQKRDEHLKSADFFDVENYKEITFSGHTVKKDNEGKYGLKGDLTILGKSNPIELEAEFLGLAKDPWGNSKAGFEIKGSINRKEWGLNWNQTLETGGVLVSEKINIACEVQLLQDAE